MTVSTILDRTREAVQDALERRAAPGDDVEWEMAMISLLCPEDGSFTMMAGFHIRLGCPESESVSTAHLILEMGRCSPDEVPMWLDRIWDELVLARMTAATNDFDGADPNG